MCFQIVGFGVAPMNSIDLKTLQLSSSSADYDYARRAVKNTGIGIFTILNCGFSFELFCLRYLYFVINLQYWRVHYRWTRLELKSRWQAFKF